MTLRAPRRRISPRTKRRYRVIREFFRRALGSSSQQDIKINSSIAINVTDIKHKIVGLENQLDAVTKQCRDIIYLDTSSRKESASELYRDIDTIKERTEESDVKSNYLETEVLYKTSESHYRESEDNEYVPKLHKNKRNVNNTNNMNLESYVPHVATHGKKRLSKNRIEEFDQSVFKNKTKSVCDNFDSAYHTSSFHSLCEPRVAKINDVSHSGRHRKRKHVDPVLLNKSKHINQGREGNNLDKVVQSCKDNHGRNRRNKHTHRDLDQDFITDIIRRQYKPVKMFGRKESGVSQFSAPVCRDHEFSIHENILEGTELCSCCYEGYNNSNLKCRHDNIDMRSLCDSRHRHSRSRHRKKHDNIYNNSDLYDLVPVKEKASPKSRRKFAENNMITYDYYREVPPSPRTLRPRLNLKSQHHTDIEDYMPRVKRHSRKNKLKKRQQYTESVESDVSSEIAQYLYDKLQKQKVSANKQNQQHDTSRMSRLQSPNLGNERTNVIVDTLNKTQDSDLSVDKTDRALCEIKDILQNFLLEIKRESTTSQCHKSDRSNKTDEKAKGINNNTQINTSTLPNSEHNVNNYNMAQCSLPPYMPGFNHSCCYPIVPVCPMNCVQSGYIVPSPSFTCATCATNTYKEHPNDNSLQQNKEEPQYSETDKLVKEIYKFIAESPTVVRKKERCKNYNDNSSGNDKVATEIQNTSRSPKTSKHDAKVGTPYVKCYSKSCEAIASRNGSEADYSGTNASYSDTVLEKLSLEPTITQSKSEFESSRSTEVNKSKANRIGRVFRSFGIFKKKKDVIEELSESESAVDVEVKIKKPPFKQEITNYTMHGQEYFHPPPISPHNHSSQEPLCVYRQSYHPAYPRFPDYPPPTHDNIYHSPRMHQQTIREPDAARHYHPHQPHPSAPPFPNYESYNVPPQVPLCLKEIEVKSAGTQSERKLTLFGKIKKKMQAPGVMTARSEEYSQRNCSTQTAQTNQVKRPGFFNWKNLQEKVGHLDDNTDPLKFSFKTQKRLAEGDIKMRSAMLKKMFYKKNPFSPRNLIVRTLLGKDKSSFGEPPPQYRPRMFF